MRIDLDSIYRQSANLISKEIEGALVIVPLESGMGDLNADLFSLNQTGAAVWKKLNGRNSLQMIIRETADEYHMPVKAVKTEIVDLIRHLCDKGLIEKV